MSDTGMNLSPVQEFYKGQTIFITGGTGFMGKVNNVMTLKSSKNNIFFTRCLLKNCYILARN